MPVRRFRWFGGILFASLVLAACGPGRATGLETTPEQAATVQAFDPLRPQPEVPGFFPSLGFDAIRPIYNPEFAVAEASPLVPEELVIGIALNGEARAYPVTVLRFREMVNDELSGIPILVTW